MSRLIPAFEQFFKNGEPVKDGLIDFFESGSGTMRKTTFADSGELIENDNPLELLGDGRTPNVFGTGTYRAVYRSASGGTILTRDPIGGDQNLAFGADWIASQIYNFNDAVRDGNDYWISQKNGNKDNQPSLDNGDNWQTSPIDGVYNQGDSEAVNRRLEDRIRDFTSVKDFGAVGDGINDDTAALNKALVASKNVYMPPGTYLTSATINIPSNTRLLGAGIGAVTIKISSAAVAATPTLNVVEIAGPTGVPNTNASMSDFTIDGNNSAVTYPIGGTGPRGTCMQMKNATNGIAERIFAKNAVVHCFDISSIDWNVSGQMNGDITYQPDQSFYCTVKNCTSGDAGDDCFTAHFSEHLIFENNYAIRTLGVEGQHSNSNFNGFEVDDGCKNVIVNNFVAVNCVRGVEVKGHDYAPAAQDVTISNGLIIGCERGLQIRHIDHNSGAEPVSANARRVNISNIVIKELTDLGKTTSQGGPRGLVVQTYLNANVSNITINNDAIADPMVATEPVVEIGGRTQNVTMSGVKVSGLGVAQECFLIDNAAGLDTQNIVVANCHGDDAATSIYRISGNCKDLVITNCTGNDSVYGIFADDSDLSSYPLKLSGNEFTNISTADIRRGSVADITSDSFDFHRAVWALNLLFQDFTTATIASGSVTATSSFMKINTEAAAGTDDLTDIVNTDGLGRFLILMAEDTAETVVVKDNIGSAGSSIQSAGDFSMTNLNKVIVLFYDLSQAGGGEWIELTRSDN